MQIIMTRAPIALAVVFVLAGATLTVARANVKVDKDPKFDFTTIKTFGWNAKPGEVKIFVTQKSNERAEPAQRKYEPVLMQAVDESLTKLGYAKAAGAAPDFELIYYVLVTTGSTSQQMGQFLPTNAQWGIPLWSPNTSGLDIYPTGAMILDAISPPGGKLIWRGMIEAKVEMDASEAERAKRTKDFMTQLVAKFPKATKK